MPFGEPERFRRGTMALVVCKPISPFRYCRTMAHGNPPEAVVWERHFLEPPVSVAEDLQVSGLVGEVFKRFNGVPYRHVDDDERIVAEGKIRRVSTFGLEPPYESRTRFGQ